MNKKSIGILAYYWPPAGGSGVQRWLRFSNHLFDLGWDVHVFTFSNPKYPNVLSIVSKPPTASPNFQLPLINQPLSIVIDVAMNLQIIVLTIVLL